LLKKQQNKKKYIKTFKTLNLNKLPYKSKDYKSLRLSLPPHSSKGGVMSVQKASKLRNVEFLGGNSYNSTIYVFLNLFKPLLSSVGTKQLQPLLFNYNYYSNVLATNKVESFINRSISSLFNNKHLFDKFWSEYTFQKFYLFNTFHVLIQTFTFFQINNFETKTTKTLENRNSVFNRERLLLWKKKSRNENKKLIGAKLTKSRTIGSFTSKIKKNNYSVKLKFYINKCVYLTNSVMNLKFFAFSNKNNFFFFKKSLTAKTTFTTKLRILVKQMFQSNLKKLFVDLFRVTEDEFYNSYIIYAKMDNHYIENIGVTIHPHTTTTNHENSLNVTSFNLVNLITLKLRRLSCVETQFHSVFASHNIQTLYFGGNSGDFFYLNSLSHNFNKKITGLLINNDLINLKGSKQVLTEFNSQVLNYNNRKLPTIFNKTLTANYSKHSSSLSKVFMNYTFTKVEVILNLTNSPLFFKYFYNNYKNLNESFNPTNFFSYLTRFYFYSTLGRWSKTNLLSNKQFLGVIKKKAIKILAGHTLHLEVSPIILYSLTGFLEYCSGKKTSVNFNPFLLNFLNFTELAHCYLWAKNLSYFRRVLGYNLYIIESLKIIYLSIKLKDPCFFINWISKMLYKISFFKYKFFLRYIKYVIKTYLVSRFEELNFRGIKLQLKGKVSVSGNARTRTVVQTVGKVGQSTLNNRILYEMRVIWTFTGSISLRIWFYF